MQAGVFEQKVGGLDAYDLVNWRVYTRLGTPARQELSNAIRSCRSVLGNNTSNVSRRW